jgi:hypothetical protein
MFSRSSGFLDGTERYELHGSEWMVRASRGDSLVPVADSYQQVCSQQAGTEQGVYP